MKEKRLLMITTGAFPPSRGPGPLRALGFSRHLPEFGWDPVVLTLRADHLGTSVDRSLVERIAPATEVHPVFVFEYWLRHLASRRPRGTRVRAKQAPHAAGTVKDSDSPVAQRRAEPCEPESTGFSDAIASGLDRSMHWLFGAEVHPGWLAAVALKARSLARGCQAIFSTSPPFQNHIAARWVARWSGLPWVADFRDPYAMGSWHLRSHQSGRRRAVRRETRALCAADAVVVVTGAMRNLYRREIPDLPPDHIHVITNGYDEDLLVRAQRIQATLAARNAGPMTLLHAGILYADECLEGLCRALRCLIDEGRARVDDFRLELVGVVKRAHQEIVRRHGLNVCLHTPGSVPQADAFERICQADILLVEAGENIAHYAIRAKLFEYMAARRPVLGLLSEGPSADLIRESGMGVCIHPGETRRVGDQLLQWLEMKRAGRLDSGQAEVGAEFDRRTLTRDLAQLLDHSIAVRARPPRAPTSGLHHPASPRSDPSG